jgi:hypothetical protein
MDNVHKRFLLFLVGCIGTRLLLVYIAKNINTTLLRYMGYITLLPAFGFMYIFLTGSRKTGAEVLGDKIWWNDLRPIHALLYFAFSYNAINGNPYSWVYLFVDVMLGLVSFLAYHFLVKSKKIDIDIITSIYEKLV